MTERAWEIGDDDIDAITKVVADLVDSNVRDAVKAIVEHEESFFAMKNGVIDFNVETGGMLSVTRATSLVELVQMWPVDGNVSQDGRVAADDEEGITDLLATKAVLEEALALVHAALPL